MLDTYFVFDVDVQRVRDPDHGHSVRNQLATSDRIARRFGPFTERHRTCARISAGRKKQLRITGQTSDKLDHKLEYYSANSEPFATIFHQRSRLIPLLVVRCKNKSSEHHCPVSAAGPNRA
jgi:hypothetical protein